MGDRALIQLTNGTHAEWLAHCAMVASHRIAEMRRERRDRHNVRSLTGWRPSRAS